MAYVITATEYLTLQGVPLMTPAWFCDDFSDLLNGPTVRGADILVGSRPGQVARRRTFDARQAVLSFVIYGDKDTEGGNHSTIRSGLLANIDAFKALLTPNMATTAGTHELAIVTPSFTRAAQVHVSPDIQLTQLGPGAARATITVTIPDGVFRSTDTTSLTLTNPTTATFTQPGTTGVIDASIIVTGSGDSMTIANATNLTSLVFGASFSGTLELNCATFAAFRNSANATNYVQTVFTPFWLPLAAGANALTITIPNASAGLTVEIETRGAWL